MSEGGARRTGRPKKHAVIEGFRRRAWYRCCVLQTGALTPGALYRQFGAHAGGSRRDWERYAQGRHTPTSIAQLIGRLHPETLAVLNSPLWTALHPSAPTDHRQVDQLLAQLDSEVATQFVYRRSDGTVARDWNSVEQEVWSFPQPRLAIDYLAAYLLLFRELRLSGREIAAERAQTWAHAAMEVIEQCPILGDLAAEIRAFISEQPWWPPPPR